jgi:hypothetical protein
VPAAFHFQKEKYVAFFFFLITFVGDSRTQTFGPGFGTGYPGKSLPNRRIGFSDYDSATLVIF